MACQGHQLWPRVLSRLQGRFSLLPASASLGPPPRASRLRASLDRGPEPHAPRLGQLCLRPGEPAVVGPSSSRVWKGAPGRVCSSPEAGLPPAVASVPGRTKSQLRGALIACRRSWLHWPRHADPAQGPRGAAGRCAGPGSGLAQQIFPVAERAPAAGTRAPGRQVRAPRSRRFACALCRPPRGARPGRALPPASLSRERKAGCFFLRICNSAFPLMTEGYRVPVTVHSHCLACLSQGVGHAVHARLGGTQVVLTTACTVSSPPITGPRACLSPQRAPSPASSHSTPTC